MKELDEVKSLILQRMEATVETTMTQAPLPSDNYGMLAELTVFPVTNRMGIITTDEWLAFLGGLMAAVEMMALINKIAMAVANDRQSEDGLMATMALAQSFCEAINASLELGLEQIDV